MNINNLSIKELPFKYFSGNLDIDNALLNNLAEWMKKTDNWKYVETDFYEQYEFDFLNTNLPQNLKYFTSNEFKKELTEKMRYIFKKEFKTEVDIIAHKLTDGQTIRIHNDYLEDEYSDSHRLLLQINTNWQNDNGGMLMFFDKDEEVTDVILPILGSVQGFEISKISNHAVSTIHNAERYTLIFYFYENTVESLEVTILEFEESSIKSISKVLGIYDDFTNYNNLKYLIKEKDIKQYNDLNKLFNIYREFLYLNYKVKPYQNDIISTEDSDKLVTLKNQLENQRKLLSFKE